MDPTRAEMMSSHLGRTWGIRGLLVEELEFLLEMLRGNSLDQ